MADKLETAAVVAGHAVSLGAIVASALDYMPHLAALGAFVWYCFAIYETKTFQGWLHRRRERRAHKKHTAIHPHNPMQNVEPKRNG